MLECVARLVAWSAGGEIVVRTAHLELQPPTVADGFAACVAAGATEVIVHPYLLGSGRHATLDLPRLAAEAAERFPGVSFRVTAPLGVHPDLGAIVLERCGVHVARRPRLSGFVCPNDSAACEAPWCDGAPSVGRPTNPTLPSAASDGPSSG
jgi:sirohydrochlorin ferrochelatase